MSQFQLVLKKICRQLIDHLNFNTNENQHNQQLKIIKPTIKNLFFFIEMFSKILTLFVFTLFTDAHIEGNYPLSEGEIAARRIHTQMTLSKLSHIKETIDSSINEVFELSGHVSFEAKEKQHMLKLMKSALKFKQDLFKISRRIRCRTRRARKMLRKKMLAKKCACKQGKKCSCGQGKECTCHNSKSQKYTQHETRHNEDEIRSQDNEKSQIRKFHKKTLANDMQKYIPKNEDERIMPEMNGISQMGFLPAQ